MDEHIAAILTRLQARGSNALELLPVYRNPDNELAWRQGARLHRAFARKLISQGHPTRGFDIAREGLEFYPEDQELRYLVALAWARGGNVRDARACLTGLLKRSDLDPAVRVEAVSLEGRLFKDQYERASDPASKSEFAQKAFERYAFAAGLPGAGTFPAINAAAMRLLTDSPDSLADAQKRARAVLERANREREDPGRANDYWVMATIGEAHLILGDVGDAADWYRKAVATARASDEVGSIATMSRDARLLRPKLEFGDELIRLLYVGSVVAFAGHMIDHPLRQSRDGLPPRFLADPQLIRETASAIRAKLTELNATVGYSSAACGADILFAEQMLEHQAELHIVLPFAVEDFYRTSVDYDLPAMRQWRSRFETVLDRATQVHFATTEAYLGDDILFEFVTSFIHGLAVNRAAARGVSAEVLVVLDGKAHAAPGGTGHFLAAWQNSGRPATHIDLRALRERVLGVPPTPDPVPPPPPSESGPPPIRAERQIKAMLFADVKGFGTLREEYSPLFHLRFLTEVDAVLRSLGNPPAFSNTWGDALYLVFHDVADCAEAAMRLLERSAQVNWRELGLGEGSPMRIGLHAGPVFNGVDPIIDRRNYFGSHVTRAARIEPVTLPGCAFVSEQFAALLAVKPDHDFVCEYVGIEYLHKKHDRCPLYRLARRAANTPTG